MAMLPSPGFELDLGFGQGVEDISVQKLVVQLADDISRLVLPRLSNPPSWAILN